MLYAHAGDHSGRGVGGRTGNLEAFDAIHIQARVDYAALFVEFRRASHHLWPISATWSQTQELGKEQTALTGEEAGYIPVYPLCSGCPRGRKEKNKGLMRP